MGFDPDMVYTALPGPASPAGPPSTILLEDKHLVFVNKPAGLLTVPAEKHHDPCLAEALTDHYRRRGFKRFHLFIAHRLDRYTSGVLVFAKTPEALNGLKSIFEEHHLRRVYLAILVGELPENAGTLSDKLVERKSLRMTIVPEKCQGQAGRQGGQAGRHPLPGAGAPAGPHRRGGQAGDGPPQPDPGPVRRARLPAAGRPGLRHAQRQPGPPGSACRAAGLPAPGHRARPSPSPRPMPADMENVLKALRNARRVVRAEAGITGEAGLYKPKITKARKIERRKRSERFSEPEAPRPARPRPAVRKPKASR